MTDPKNEQLAMILWKARKRAFGYDTQSGDLSTMPARIRGDYHRYAAEVARLQDTEAERSSTLDPDETCDSKDCEQFREWLSGQNADADKRARAVETTHQRIRQDVDAALCVTDGMLIQRDNLNAAGHSDRAAGIDAVVTEFRAVLHRIRTTLDETEADAPAPTRPERVSTSPTRDEATGLETLCALLHTADETDPNVVKDVAWRTFNLIRAWREQGTEIERLRAELAKRTDERDKDRTLAAVRGDLLDGTRTKLERAQQAGRDAETERAQTCTALADADKLAAGLRGELAEARAALGEERARHGELVAEMQRERKAAEDARAELIEVRKGKIEQMLGRLNDWGEIGEYVRQLINQRNAVIDLAAREQNDAAADVQAGGPVEQLDDLTVPVHDLLIAVGAITPDQKETGRG
ncbi:hypothetical protein [Actinomadura geliboluensis]|uniref:hypothetical protein n=1 Tax=Actinomadura geliboluensis TaxID=882440 RepID=UPI0036A0D3C4